MATTITAVLQNYDPSTDSATLLLTGVGVVDQAVGGVAIAANIDRSLLIAGTVVELSMPDVHRLCEATVIALNPPFPSGSYTGSGGQILPWYGRTGFYTDATGFGSVLVSYNGPTFAFSGPPTQITLALDYGSPATGTTLTPYNIGVTTMNVKNTGTPAPANVLVMFTWQVWGPQ
jgi:hypothetical protein